MQIFRLITHTSLNIPISKFVLATILLLVVLVSKANITTFTFSPTYTGPYTVNFNDITKWDNGLPTTSDSAVLILNARDNGNTSVVILNNENFSVKCLTIKSLNSITNKSNNKCSLSINAGGSLMVSNTTTVFGGAKNYGTGNISTFIDINGTFSTNDLVFDAVTSSLSARNNIYISADSNSTVTVGGTVSISSTIAQNNAVYLKNAAPSTYNIVDLTTTVPNVQTAFNVSFSGYVTINGKLSLSSNNSSYLVDSSGSNNSGILFNGDSLKIGANAGTATNYPIKTLSFGSKSKQTISIASNSLMTGTFFQNVAIGFADTAKEIVKAPIPTSNFNKVMEVLTPLLSTQYPYVGFIGTSIGAGAAASTYDSSFFPILMRKIQDYQGLPHEESVLCDFGQLGQHGLSYDNVHYYLNYEGPTGRCIVTSASDFAMSFTGKYNRLGFWTEHSLTGQKIRYFMDGVLYHTDTIKSRNIYSTLDSANAFTPDSSKVHNWYVRFDSAIELTGLIRLQNSNYSKKPFSFINYCVYGSCLDLYKNNMQDMVATSGISSGQKGVILYENGANDFSVETLDQYKTLLYKNMNTLVAAGLKVFYFYDHRFSIEHGNFSYDDGWAATKDICERLGIACYSLGSLDFYGNNWIDNIQDIHPNNLGMLAWEKVLEYGIANAQTAWNLPTVQLAGPKSIFLNNLNAPNNLTIKKGTTLNLNTLTLDKDSNTGTGTFNNYGTLIIGGTNNFPDKYTRYNLDTSSTVVYNGNRSQIISNEAIYGNIIFNNQSTYAPQFTNVNSVNVANSAAFINGIIGNKNSNPLTFTNSIATSIINNQNSYVDGYISKVGSAAFTFQLGSNSETIDQYHPLTLGSGFANATCRYHYGNVPSITSISAGITSIDPLSYWETNISGSASIQVITRDESSTFSVNGTYFFIGFKISSGNWEKLPSSNSISNTVVGRQQLNTGVISLSDYNAFAVGSNTFLKPIVTLTNFTAKANSNCKIGLAWASSTEVSSSYYIIQYSIDNGINYIDIDTVSSRNSSIGGSYTDTLAGISNGNASFRLKIVYKDGGTILSQQQPIFINCSLTDITLAPNPVTNTLFINGMNGKNTIKIFENTGQLVTNTTTNSGSVNINMANYAKGIYLVLISNALSGDKTVHKILKE